MNGPREEISIKIDEYRRYYRTRAINKHEIKYLLNHGYQIQRYKDLMTGKMTRFIIQPRSNESPMHFFLTRNIAEYLEKNGIEVELYATVKPDIVFKIHGEMYAIEIETGSAFTKRKNFNTKLKLLEEKYDKWLFVVTKRHMVQRYKLYGNTVDKRYVKGRLDKFIKLAKRWQK